MPVTYQRQPDFFVIGGLCCATSALTWILRQRPEIALRGISRNLRNDENLGDVERDLSRFSSIFSTLDPNKLCGAIMPHYLALPGVAGKIHELAGNSRLVVMLRDPLDRLRSHYLYNVAAGVEGHPFEVSIQQEENRCAGADPLSLARYGYLRQGCYAELLDAYVSQFGRDQIHVIYMDDFINDTGTELAMLYKFLGFMKTHDIVLKKDTAWISSSDTYRAAVAPPYPVLYRILGPLSRIIIRRSASTDGDNSFQTRLGRRLENTVHPLPVLKKKSIQWIRDYYRPHDEALAEWMGDSPPWVHTANDSNHGNVAAD
jgi:hypothetical protein